MDAGFVTEISPECRAFLLDAFSGGEERFDAFLEKMRLLQGFLYETNEKFNLTALPPEAFWSKHVADSLSLIRAFPDLGEKPFALLDLGCGAGFPSLVLAAAFPLLKVTAVDSTGKKISFVRSAAEKLSLENLSAIHGRGNELARKAPFKGAYDLVTARAVSSAENLVKESFSFLKVPGGVLAVYRTSSQLAQEKAFLDGNKHLVWRSTEPFSLPENAGTRLFLLMGSSRA